MTSAPKVEVVKDNWREVSIRISRNVERALAKAGLETETQIKAFITDLPGVPSDAAKARGGTGLVDTSNYRDSWTTHRSLGSTRDYSVYTIGSPVEYGPYLEYGTRFHRAFPHVLPAAEKIRDKLLDYFRNLDK